MVCKAVCKMKTLAQIKALAADGKRGMVATAQRTLYVRIAEAKKTGSVSMQWMQRLTVDGKRHNVGLGPVDVIPFGEARKTATLNLAAVYQGRNPLAERREAQRLAGIPDFATVTRETHDAQRKRWTTARAAYNWLRLVEIHAFPALGARRVDRIETAELMDVLLRTHRKVPDAARRLRQCMAVIFDHAIAAGHRKDNPAEAVKSAMPKRSKSSVKNHATMGYKRVAASYAALDDCEHVAARLMLRFLTLTACRSLEARGARWNEIDRHTATWEIPASRMKTREPHSVALSGAALDVLADAEVLADGSGLVFPSPYRKGGMVSDKLIRERLRASIGVPCSVHGQRSAFDTWAAENGQSRELAESALSHAKGSTTERYQRSDLLERRRPLMEKWAQHVTGAVADVVRLRA